MMNFINKLTIKTKKTLPSQMIKSHPNLFNQIFMLELLNIQLASGNDHPLLLCHGIRNIPTQYKQVSTE